MVVGAFLPLLIDLLVLVSDVEKYLGMAVKCCCGKLVPPASTEPISRSYPVGGEQLHIGAAVVKRQPAPVGGIGEAGAELAGAALQREQERRIDLLDVDAAVLDRLDAGGELDELACGGFGIGIAAGFGLLHASASLSRSARAISLALASASARGSRSGSRRPPATSS
jgi:hypothetical protein